jgi:hypothetical protein
LRELRRSGPLTHHELRRRFTYVNNYFKRAIDSLRPQLVIVGAGPSATYAARRRLPHVETPVLVFREGGSGDAHVMALHPIEPWGWFVESFLHEVPSGFLEGDIDLDGPLSVHTLEELLASGPGRRGSSASSGIGVDGTPG